jgi:hypothetical protein
MAKYYEHIGSQAHDASSRAWSSDHFDRVLHKASYEKVVPRIGQFFSVDPIFFSVEGKTASSAVARKIPFPLLLG